MPDCATVYLGLGSNVGRRPSHIRKALAALAAHPRLRLLAVSSLYRSSPVGPRQREFINAAAKLRTDLTPRQLLIVLQRIEQELGRPASHPHWGPRVIDIDILFYGDRVLKGPGLEVPHRELHRRLFVLVPLAEIAPRLRHPRLKLSVKELRDSLLLTAPEQKVTMYRKKKAPNGKKHG